MECKRKECKTKVCKQIIPTLNVKISLNVNCYTASKLSVFGFFQVRIFPYSVEMWENTDHYGHFSPRPYVSKSKKKVLSNITFILIVISENDIIFVSMGLYFRIKK